MRVLLFLFVLAFVSCSPNAYQLKQYKQAEALKDAFLIIQLPDNSEIELLREYGQHKKANRLEKTINKKDDWIQNAFKEHFSFCPVLFQRANQEDIAVQEDQVATKWIQRHQSYDDKNEQTYLGIIVEAETKIEVGIKTHFVSENDYAQVVELLDKRLKKMAAKSSALKSS